MLEYNLDLTPDSYQHVLTLDALAQSFPFYPIEVGYFHAKDAYYTKRSGLDNYLLIITVGGSGHISWKGQKAVLEKGQAVLIHCNDYHEYATASGMDWRFFYLHFSAASMEGYHHLFLKSLSPVQLVGLETSCSLMERLYKYAGETSSLVAAAQSNIISALLTEMAVSLAKRDSEFSKNHRVQKLADFIRENCEKSLSLDNFMEMVHLSKYHLIRIFEKQIGMSPYKYLHLCRIERSISLLKNTELSISQIAGMVGYADSVVYIRHFKSFHKMTPAKYRANSLLVKETSFL
ncbi:MAG: AraC family transcriptional regulator [Oscillospiraceae bacterium]|nr:AraC family transcriptional regulator [Oscillospiraceae bacterium]